MTLLHIHHEALAESAGLGHVLLSAFEESIYICFLVIVMMTLIEIFNVSSKGRIFKGLERHRFGQAVVSAGLGMLPGCFGGFAGVSLYSHRIIGFGALIAMLIATTGDEAFLMLAMFPREAVFIMLGLFVGGVTIGYIVDIVVRYMQRRGRWMSLGADRRLTTTSRYTPATVSIIISTILRIQDKPLSRTANRSGKPLVAAAKKWDIS